MCGQTLVSYTRTRPQLFWPSGKRFNYLFFSQFSTSSKCRSASINTYQSFHPPRLHDKVAIITGASSGLGRAIALQYASHGTKLVVCADLQSKPRSMLDETESGATHDIITSTYGAGKAIFVKANVNNRKEVSETVQIAVENAGSVDILVNCAGLGNVSGSPLLHDLAEEDWDRVVNVNLRGTFLTNKYVLRQMMKQSPRSLASASVSSQHPPPGTVYQSSTPDSVPESNIGLLRRGTIINVSSMLGSIALPDGTAAYCASKGGVLNLTRQLALDYAPYLININALCPGFLETAMTSGNRRTAPLDHTSASTTLSGKTGGLANNQGGDRKTTAEQTGERMRCATPFGEWGKVEDVARMAVSLASEDAAWVTGAEIVVDGGYSAGGFGGVAAEPDARVLRARLHRT